jgi:hypothetical protein
MRATTISKYVILILLLTLAPSRVTAADVKGTVTDYGTGKPLDGVRVSVSDGANTKGPKATVNGAYSFDSIVPGSYTVRFDLTGYSPRPDDHPLTIDNANDAKQVDAELMQAGAGADYYVSAGKRFAQLVKQDGGKAANYKSRWAQLRELGPAVVAKIHIVQGIADADTKAKNELPLDQFLKFDPKEIDKLAEPFAKALQGKDKMPEKGFTDVGDELLADVVLGELRKSKADQKTKDDFVIAFDRNWKDTKATAIVKQHYEKEKKTTLPK